jgi:hypothetical protein
LNSCDIWRYKVVKRKFKISIRSKFLVQFDLLVNCLDFVDR